MAQEQKPPSFIPDEDTPPSFVPDEESIPESAPVEPVDNRSMLRKGWDSLNTPLVEFPIRKQIPNFAQEHPIANFGLGLIEGASSPIGVATGGLTGLEFGLGAKTPNLLNKINKGVAAGSVGAGINDLIHGELGQGTAEIGLGALGLRGVGRGIKNQAGKEIPVLAESINTPPRPKMKANLDGTFTNLNTGITVDKTGKPVQIQPNAQVTPQFKDTRGLSKKKGSDPLSPTNNPEWDIKTLEELRKEIRFTNIDISKFNNADELQEYIDARDVRAGAKTMKDYIVKPENIIEMKLDPNQAEITPEGTHISTTIVDKKGTTIQEILNFPRAVQSSWDMSFPFRQGLGSIHKKAWWTSWDDMVKAYGSDKAFRAGQEAIKARPLFKNVIGADGKMVEPSFADQAGLQLTDLTTNREEQFMSTWADKFPGVKRSNRAYTAFGNQLRADMFEELIGKAEKLGMDPQQNMPLAKSIASFVNSASGRGSLGSLEKSAKELNTLFFSPRLMSSRMRIIKDGLNPLNYYSATLSNDPAKKMMARESLKSVAALTGAWTTIAGAAALAGGEVSLDPTSADFGKIKIGNTRLDPGGGLQQYLVWMSRMVEGSSTSSVTGNINEFGSKYGLPTRMDASLDFLGNKLSPYLQYARSLFDASKEYPTPIVDKTIRMVTPMLAQDLIDIMQEDPSAFPFILPAAVGMGTQTYGEKSKTDKKNPGMFGDMDINFKGGRLY